MLKSDPMHGSQCSMLAESKVRNDLSLHADGPSRRKMYQKSIQMGPSVVPSSVEGGGFVI